eukprot:g5069.t1
MPMITPCYPAFNSMKATWATRKIIIEELKRGAEKTKRVTAECKLARRNKKKGTMSQERIETILRKRLKKIWKHVFDPYCFPADDFDVYVSIGCEATTANHFDSWKGWLSSQLISFSHSTKGLHDRTGQFESLRLWKDPCETKPWWPRNKLRCDCHVCSTEYVKKKRRGLLDEEEEEQDDDGNKTKDLPPRHCAFWIFGVKLNKQLCQKGLSLKEPFDRFWKTEQNGPGAVMTKAMFSTDDPAKREESLKNMSLHMKCFSSWNELKRAVPPDFLYGESFGGREHVLEMRRGRRVGKEPKTSAASSSKSATAAPTTVSEINTQDDAETLGKSDDVDVEDEDANALLPLAPAFETAEASETTHEGVVKKEDPEAIDNEEEGDDEEPPIVEDDDICASWWARCPRCTSATTTATTNKRAAKDGADSAKKKRPKRNIRLVLS